ncbi:MAG: hypothetical protein WCG20_00735 [bacterium]
MYTKEQIWNSFTKEFRIIKHLSEKIPAGGEHHKPTEKQRTTLELLHYLATFGGGMFTVVATGDGAAFMNYAKNVTEITVENFAQAIDNQEAAMKEIYDAFTDESLAEEVSIWGQTQSRAIFLLDCLRMLTAYKMQLFLYIKASGNFAVGTSNVWAGMDMPAPKE